MAKRLTDRIAEAAKSAQVPQLGAQRLAAVLGIKDEIEEVVKAGWALATIWRQLQNEGRFDGDYQAFRRAWSKAMQVKEHPKKEAALPAPDPVLPAASPPAPAAPAPSTKTEDGPRIISDPEQPFSFDNLKKR